ncbi:hypothetical protein BC826DRAFT_593584 [Russula brevipes]|nr:hypothetical protein BC826DRAFT_593584 [Russula brevipes]
MLYTMSHSQQLFPPHVSSYRTQFPFTSPAVTSYNRRDDRRHSPTRYPEYPSNPSRLPHYRSRVESPPPRLRGSDRLDQRDPLPDLPQRHPGGVSDAHDPDTLPNVERWMMTMATSHQSAGVLSDRNRLGDPPACRTRAVGETRRAGVCRAPCAISRLAEGPGTNVDAIAKHKTRDKNKESRTDLLHGVYATPPGGTFQRCARAGADPPRPRVAQDPARAGGPRPP